jgi:uncharacterized membrane protein
MQVGVYIDGRDLSYDQVTSQFDVGGTQVTLAQVLEYDAFGQIRWPDDEMRGWVYGLSSWRESEAAAAAAQARAEAKARSKEARALKMKAVREALSDMQQQSRYGHLNAEMVCPHCQTNGAIHTKLVTQKRGISGGKATAAVLTGGVSLLATGLSRKEQATEAHCGHCGNTWYF